MTFMTKRILELNSSAACMLLEVEVKPGNAIYFPTIYLKIAVFSSEKSLNEIPRYTIPS